MSAIRLVIVALIPAMCVPAGPAQGDDAGGLTATLSTSHRHVPPGRPIWVDFTITNQADEPVELAVPGTKALPSAGIVGLPITHVFSGEAFAALSISGELGQEWGRRPGLSAAGDVRGPGPRLARQRRRQPGGHPSITRSSAGPGSIGCAGSPTAGRWSPTRSSSKWTSPNRRSSRPTTGRWSFASSTTPPPTPSTTSLKLAKAGFYDNLTFHRIVPGYCIQGGCPKRRRARAFGRTASSWAAELSGPSGPQRHAVHGPAGRRPRFSQLPVPDLQHARSAVGRPLHGLRRVGWATNRWPPSTS